MKIVLLCSILFWAIAMPVLAELTAEDIEKIDAKLKESETRIKEYIDIKDESVDKRLSLITTLIVGLIALIVLAVGIPQILIAWRSRTEQIQSRKSIEERVLERMTEISSEDKRMIEQLVREQEQKIETLTREVETLKQQRTVNP